MNTRTLKALLGLALVAPLAGAATVLHHWDFNDTTGTSIQDAANSANGSATWSSWLNSSLNSAASPLPATATTGDGTMRIQYDPWDQTGSNSGIQREIRVATGLADYPSTEIVAMTVVLAGWSIDAPQTGANAAQFRFSFMNSDPITANSQVTSEWRLTRTDTGVALTEGVYNADTNPGVFFDAVNAESLTVTMLLDRPNDVFSIHYQIGASASVTLAESVALSGTRDARSFRIVATGNPTVDGAGFLDIDSFTVSVIPEPGAYAALAGLIVLGLAAARRRRAV